MLIGLHLSTAQLHCSALRQCKYKAMLPPLRAIRRFGFICLKCVLLVVPCPQLLRSGPDSPLHPAPLWSRPGLAGGRCCDAALVREFRREAQVVRGGMEGDLIKVRQLAGHTRHTGMAGWHDGPCCCFLVQLGIQPV